MSTPLDTFLPLVYLDVMGCPEPTALLALRYACIEFCRRTDVVQRIQAAADTVPATEDYAITVPTDMVLSRVLGVAWQGRWLTPAPLEQVQSDLALRGVDIGSAKVLTGDPKFYFLKSPGATSVSLYPVPATASTATILIQASFQPTSAAAAVEDLLFSEWGDAIAAGAVARIKSTAGQPYSSDPTRDRAEFERAVSTAKRQARTGKVTNVSRVAPRSFTL